MSSESGRLFVVATPIGNLEDITLRAVRVLREVDRVLAEDTRRTRTLLHHLQLTTRLESLHAHTPPARIDALASELAAGAQFALVTDAGTPIVSDPGKELVQAALAAGVAIEAIPGASAVMAALCVAGIDAGRFRFVGFLPRSGAERSTALTAIATDELATILFESPERTRKTLEDLLESCGAQRRAAVCRELTKLHEQVLRGELATLAGELPERVRGEVTIVVAGRDRDRQPERPSTEELDREIDARLASGASVRDIARELADRYEMEKREVYQRVLGRAKS